MASGKKTSFQPIKEISLLSQEQRKRRQDIDNVCQDHGSQLYYDIIPLYDHDYGWPYIIYLPQYNLLFCGIPKAGTTTWVVGRDQGLTMLCVYTVYTLSFYYFLRPKFRGGSLDQS